MIHRTHKLLFGFILVLCATSAIASQLSGRVVGITDGDTLTILDKSNTEVKIRLAAIDAPEKAQPFGQKAKGKLSDICYNKQANVKVVDMDRYGRTVGEVNCAGLNANELMVQAGLAWVYRKYAKGYGHLYPLEDDAKAAKRGLWLDPNPVPPWDWRKMKREKNN